MVEQVIPKCLRFWKLALRGGCLTSFYATLRTRSRGALPLLSADSSPLSEGQGGKPPAPPKSPLFVFRLPSHYFVVVVATNSAPQTNLFPQSLQPQRCVFTRVLPLFTMFTDPHAGQQSGVVFVDFSWTFACDGRSPRCPCSQRW